MCLFWFVILLVNSNHGGCPFMNQMSRYNFTGNWSYNFDNKSYIMNICHLKSSEIYFTLSLENNSGNNNIVGYGSGNWSNDNMAIVGKKLEISIRESNGYSIFAMGMNQQQHQWYYQDIFKSVPVNQISKQIHDYKMCGIPYGIDIRQQYWNEFWDAKNGYVGKFWNAKQKLRRELIKKGETIDMDKLDRMTNDKIGEFVYHKKPHFPTLFHTSWISNDRYIVSFQNENNSCIMDQLNGNIVSLYNITVMYDGIGIGSQYNNGNIMFLQTNEDKMFSAFLMDNNNLYNYMEWNKYIINDNNIECSKIKNRDHSEL